MAELKLEREVTAVNPNAQKRERVKPLTPELSELRANVDTQTLENLKVLQDLLSQKERKAASLAETIKWASEVCRNKHDPLRKKLKSVSLGNSKKGRQPVAPSIKAAVHQRDNSQCTHKDEKCERCTEKRWVQMRHIQNVRYGGTNTPPNLTLLCFAHHQLRHSLREH